MVACFFYSERLLQNTVDGLRVPTLVAGERLKHTRLLSRPRGQLRISCLSLQLRLILLAQRLVEARRAGPAHRLRACAAAAA